MLILRCHAVFTRFAELLHDCFTQGRHAAGVISALGWRVLGDFRCAACGYGIVPRESLPERCPMCGIFAWDPFPAVRSVSGHARLVGTGVDAVDPQPSFALRSAA